MACIESRTRGARAADASGRPCSCRRAFTEGASSSRHRAKRATLRRHMGAAPAVLFFQWRPDDERDEIAEAKAILKAEHDLGAKGRARGVLPLIAEHTCTSADPQKFAAEVERELAKLPDLQVLYLAAHGLDDALARDKEGQIRLDFNDLGPFLARGLAKASNITAVFGLCFALSPSSFLTSVLPAALVEAYGFTRTPEAKDVAALIAGVLAEDVTLMADASKANAELFGAPHPAKGGRNVGNSDLGRGSRARGRGTQRARRRGRRAAVQRQGGEAGHVSAHRPGLSTSVRLR